MPPQPSANNLRPLPILIPIQQTQGLIRAFNQGFAPRAIMGTVGMMGKALKGIWGGLKSILRLSETFNNLLEPLGVILGLIGDSLTIALMPVIQNMYRGLGQQANQLIAGVSAANGNTDKIGSSISDFIVGVMDNLIPFIDSFVNIISGVLESPGFMNKVLPKLTELGLTIINGGLSIISSVLVGMNSAVAGGLSDFNILKDDFIKLANNITSIIVEAVKLAWNAVQFLVAGMIEGVMSLFFPKMNQSFGIISNAFDNFGKKSWNQRFADFERGMNSYGISWF